MKHEDLDDYFKDIAYVKEKYKGKIEIYKGLEVDYIPQFIGPGDPWIKDLKLDYTIGSVHFSGKYENGLPGEIDSTHPKFLHCLKYIYNDDVQALVKDYFHLNRQMLKESIPDIIGHMDKIKMHNTLLWDEQASWYRGEVLATLEEIKSLNTIVEVNTRGIYKKITPETYPSKWILKLIHQMGIPIHINSDGHLPREITMEFSNVADLLHTIGFREFKILLNKEWNFVKFEKNGLLR
jgi:histidinol-phosphatase (PHP family)